MLFNSIDFAIFLPIVFIIYWLLKEKLQAQNILIVIASYVFYGWWDPKFLILIGFSTLVDYFLGNTIVKTDDKKKRKWLLITSLTVNLGLLGVFKYYNFFAENFNEAFTFFGTNFRLSSLEIILPVGISFYTFQTLSYTIDVYRGHLKPTKDFISFAAFVSFFPQLVAGPIERASHLLPQFYKKRIFDYPLAVDGMRQILWGLFKKMVIADNAAVYADLIFNNYTDYSGATLFLGAIFFTFQIYGDFSGYSDIAIGTAKLFGFDLKQNFAFPYFSRDIAEFWRRWHISLSTWFRDYLYIPLGGSRGGLWMKVRNTFIIFLVSGFWHGANWTFIVWGTLNALYFLPLLLTNNNRNHLNIVAHNKNLPSIKEMLQIGLTFCLTVFAWIFFRAENMSVAWSYLSRLFTYHQLENPDYRVLIASLTTISLVIFFILIEWLQRNQKFGLQTLFATKPRWFRWSFYSFIIFLIGMYMETDETPFIYFQF